MKKLGVFIFSCVLAAVAAPTALAADVPDLAGYTSDTMQILTLISTAAAVFFLVVGGYTYITSSGAPEKLEQAKKTIKNALLGLLLVLGSQLLMSVFRTAFQGGESNAPTAAISIEPITTAEPAEGLAQILIDAVSGFMQNIAQSSIEPLVSGIMGYLTTTPSLLDNSVIMKFWLLSLGIVDSLFVILVALLGLQVMSASVFGFEELPLNQLLPRIGLAFLGANISLFLADYVIVTCNVLVKAVLDATGGLQEAWLQTAVHPVSLVVGATPLITLIFLIIFLVVAIVLLLMHISRLIMISLGGVLAPFIFLLWALPKTAGFAELAVRTYFVTVFMVFIHVVTIQLAAAFLALPEDSTNSLVAIATAIGLFFTLLKTPSLMMQLATQTAQTGAMQKLGGQLMNVISTSKAPATEQANVPSNPKAKVPREVKYI